MTAVIALIDFEKCVYLEFRRLRVFSLIRPQLSGGPEGIRTPDFYLARVALSQLSYRPIYRTFNQPLLINFVVTAASLNLYHFNDW